jgi:serine/threonine protein kinase
MDSFDQQQIRAAINSTRRSLSGRRFGNYQLGEEISRGGMGVAYQAQDVRDGQIVVVKLMLVANLQQQQVARFKREAEALAKVDHPNIVALRDFECLDQVPYLAMDYVDGDTLDNIVKDKLRTDGAVPDFSWTTEIMKSIGEALLHCHDRGILHRDLKPENIIVRRLDHEPILIDFGLVKRDSKEMGESLQSLTPRLSESGAMIGTPAFMSPEQIDSGKSFGEVSTASDVWGLGATLYFCLTGGPPFGRTSSQNAIAALISQKPPSITAVNPDVPKWLAQLCHSCLNKNSKERPELRSFIDALREAPDLKVWPKILTAFLVTLTLLAALVFGLWKKQESELADIWQRRLKTQLSSVKKLNSSVASEDLERVLAKIKSGPRNNEQAKDPQFLKLKAKVQLWLGRSQLRTGRLKEAQRSLKEASAVLLSSDIQRQTLKLGLKLATHDKEDSTFELLLELLDRCPKSAEIHAWAALYFLEQQQLPRAHEEAQIATDLGWRDPNLETLSDIVNKRYRPAYQRLQRSPKIPVQFQRQVVRKILEDQFKLGKHGSHIAFQWKQLNPAKNELKAIVDQFKSVIEQNFVELLKDFLKESSEAIITMEKTLVPPLNRLSMLIKLMEKLPDEALKTPRLLIGQIAISCWLETARSPEGLARVNQILAVIPGEIETAIMRLQCAVSIEPPLQSAEINECLDSITKYKLSKQHHVTRAMYVAYWHMNKSEERQAVELLEVQIPRALSGLENKVKEIYFWGLLGRIRCRLKLYKDAVKAQSIALSIEHHFEIARERIFAMSQIPDLASALKATHQSLTHRRPQETHSHAVCLEELAKIIALKARDRAAGQIVQNACLQATDQGPRALVPLAMALHTLGDTPNCLAFLDKIEPQIKASLPKQVAAIQSVRRLISAIKSNRRMTLSDRLKLELLVVESLSK